MSLRERFEIFGLKRDDGVRTFEAREISTGRPVFVHLLAADSVLLRRVDLLPAAEKARVIERGDEGSDVFLVTDRLAEHAGFKEWLLANEKPLGAKGAWQIPSPTVDTQFADLFGAPPAPAPTLGPTPALSNTAEVTLQMPAMTEMVAPKPPAPSPNEPGEFTRQFAMPAAPVANKPKESGEFTKMFQAPIRPAPPKDPAPLLNQQPMNQQPASGQQPGEFTQMLQAQRTSSPTAPSTSVSGDGEFTKYFQSPMTPAANTPPSVPLTPPMPPKSQRGAGEFTQVFGKSDIPAPPPVLRPSTPLVVPAAEVTQAFERPRLTPPPFTGAPVVPNRGQGEYTRQFSVPAPLTLGQGQAPTPVSRMPPIAPLVKQKSRLPLFLLAGGGFLLVLALVLYFVMRSRGA